MAGVPKIRWAAFFGCLAFGLLGIGLIVADVRAKRAGVSTYVTSGNRKTAPMYAEQVILIGALVAGASLVYAIKTRPELH